MAGRSVRCRSRVGVLCAIIGRRSGATVPQPSRPIGRDTACRLAWKRAEHATNSSAQPARLNVRNEELRCQLSSQGIGLNFLLSAMELSLAYAVIDVGPPEAPPPRGLKRGARC